MKGRFTLPLLCAALAAGEFAGFASGCFASYWPVAALAALLVLLFGYGRAVRGWGFAATFLVGVVAAALTLNRQNAFLAAVSLTNRPLEVSLAVGDPVTVRPAEKGGSWVSFVSEVEGVRVKPILCLPAGEPPPRVGDVWRVAGWLDRGERGRGRTRTLWVRGRGTFAAPEVRAANRLAARLAAARRDFSRRAGIGLDHAPEIANLNRAILLGERSRMDPATRRTFVDAGTIHVFAISGLHVMVLAFALRFLLVLCFVPVRFAGIAAMAPLWLYVLLVGAAPSAVRAATMATIAFAAPVFWRRPDGLVAWSLTFLIVHLAAPANILNVGSAFSFAVMLGLLLWGQWREWTHLTRFEVVGYAFAAWAAGVPIAAHAFGRFTPGGLVSNLALIPAASVSVIASALGIATSYVSDWIAAHVNNAAYLFTSAMVVLSNVVASVPGSSCEIAPWSLGLCAAWYAVVGLTVWLVGSVVRRRRHTL